jgi:hypothetical protein
VAVVGFVAVVETGSGGSSQRADCHTIRAPARQDGLPPFRLR